jgi:hypothetical protein
MGKHEDGYERVDKDFYPTPPWATEALLSHINVAGLRIWECAAGDGRMAKVLEAAGAAVYSTDIAARGYELDAQFDYTGPHPVGLPTFDGVITNPPFGPRATLADAFIRVALRNLGRGFAAFLLPTDFDSAKTRAPLFDCEEFAGKIILRKRCKWFDTPGSASPKENHAWYLWGAVPWKPTTRFIDPVIRYAPLAEAA